MSQKKSTPKTTKKFRNNTSYILIALVAALTFGTFAAYQLVGSEAARPARTPSVPNIAFSPSTQTASVGDFVTIEVREDSGTIPVNAVQANILYPSSILEFVSTDSATSPFTIQAQAEQTAGRISLARGSAVGTAQTGNQLIARVTFKVLQASSATLQYDPDTAVVSSDTNTNILTTTDSKGTAVIKPPRTKGK